MTARLALTRQEAAEACGVSVDTIGKAINSGALRAKRSGKNKDGDPVGKCLIRTADLEAWLEQLEDA